MESGRSPGSAVGWRATQLAGVQVIYLLRLVILARLLAPEAFGLLAIATVAISVLMRLSDLGMIQALVQRPEPSELEYDVAWTAGLIRASAVAAAIAVLAPTAARLFAEPGAAPIMQVLVLRPVIDAARSIGTARLTRELRFRELAFMHVPAALTDACIAVALAGTLGVWALVVGALTGAIVQTALSYVLAPHRPRLRFQAHAAEPLVRYGRWVLLTGIIALAASSVQQLLLSRHLGAGALGVYYLAAKLAFLPVETTSTVLGSVAFPLYAAQREDDRATATAFGTLFAGQAILLFPLYAMLVVLAPSFEAALGTRWIGATPVLQVLGVACIIGTFGESLSPLLMGRARPDRVLVLELLQSAALLLCVWPLLRAFGVVGAALAWLLANTVTQVLAVWYSRSMVPGLIAGTGPWLGSAIAAALISAAAALLAASALDGFLAVATGGIAGLLAASAGLWLLDRRYELRLVELLPWSPGWAQPARVHPASR
jgi:O-antigen/teichoic acid export membrane protein